MGAIERIDLKRGSVFEWAPRNVSLPSPWESAFPILRASLPNFFGGVSAKPHLQTTGWWRDGQLDATLQFGNEGFIRIQYSPAKESIETGRHNGVEAVITKEADACTFEYTHIKDELTKLAVVDESLQVIQNAFQR